MSDPNLPALDPDAHVPSVEQILGVAVFDEQGLPLEYFVTQQQQEFDWIQSALQYLGLQQLLIDEMNLPQLDYGTLRTKAGNIAVLPAPQGFIVLLLKRSLPQEKPNIDHNWIVWACHLVDTVVRTDARFKSV